MQGEEYQVTQRGINRRWPFLPQYQSQRVMEQHLQGPRRKECASCQPGPVESRLRYRVTGWHYELGKGSDNTSPGGALSARVSPQTRVLAQRRQIRVLKNSRLRKLQLGRGTGVLLMLKATTIYRLLTWPKQGTKICVRMCACARYSISFKYQNKRNSFCK